MMFFARASVAHDHAVAATPVTIALSPEAVHGNQTNNNLKQLGLAMHNHMDAFKHLPVADGSDRDKKPRLAGKPTGLWTLNLVAEVCHAKGWTPRRLTGEAVRQALKRLGIRWRRAKHWITSPDPAYARKKNCATG